jgi:hypothetical protein
MTLKQFYSRLHALKAVNLITKVHDQKRHQLTSLGLIVHKCLQLMDKGISLEWELNTVDTVKHSNATIEHKDKLFNTLITYEPIRSIIGEGMI